MELGPGHMSLEELTDAADLKFGLPLFQRELNWSWDHQAELLKSIMTGIPIGTILLWKYDQELHEEKINVRPINDLEKSNDDIKTLVLDGQQRVTFLTWLWKSSNQEKYADVLKNHSKKDGGYIYLHLDEDAKKPKQKSDETDKQYEEKTANKTYGRFSIGKKRFGDYCTENNVVNVQYLLKKNTQKRHVIAQFRNHVNCDWIDDLYAGLHQYRINTFVLGSHISYGDALLIYERVNVAGTKLKGEDVTEAVFISKWKDLYYELKNTSRNLSDDGKLKQIFSRKKLMNCLTDELYNTISAKPKDLDVFRPLDMNGNELTSNMVEEAFKLINKSLLKVKKILKECFLIENDKTISTVWPIVIASAYIRKHYPDDDADMGENRGKLAKWMALSILRKHYTGGSTNTKVEDDLEAVRDSKSPWKKLYENMANSDLISLNSNLCSMFDETDLGDFNSSKNPPKMNSWLGTLYKAALYHFNARDPHTRELLRYEDNLQWHHIFPKALFDPESPHFEKELGTKIKANAKDYPANLCLISKKTNLRIGCVHPKIYIPPLVNGNVDAANIHQLNNPASLSSKNFLKFLIWREKELTKFINRFLNEIEGNVKPKEELRHVSHFNIINNKKEGQNIEYKATLRIHTEGENIGEIDKELEAVTIRELAGMLNSGGGTLYIGVEEKDVKKGKRVTKVTRIIGIEQDIRSLDSQKSGKVGSFEFLEAHLRGLFSRLIVLPSNLRYRKNDLITVDEIEDPNGDHTVMAITVYPWPESNAAVKEKSNSTIAVEYRRDGGSKNKTSHGTWTKSVDIIDGKKIETWQKEN